MCLAPGQEQLLMVTVTGVRAQADCMALVGPSAQTLLLSGDSRAEGNNPHGLDLSSGVREHLHPVPTEQ